MKVTVRITVSNDMDCANLYVNTGAREQPIVITLFRQIDIPDLKKGWGLRDISVEKD